MWKLRLYLSQVFLSRWFVTTFGILILIALLDSLANASEIAAAEEGGSALRYLWLRLPVIFDQIYLFALMLALLLTYVSLIRRNELVAVQGVGMSISTQVRMLAPVVVAVSAVAAFAIDRALPPAVRALDAWGVADYEGGNVSAEEPLWLNDGGTFVRITGRRGVDGLLNLMFFERDELGHVRSVSWAQSAQYIEADGGWRLSGVEVARVQGAGAPPDPKLIWETNQDPSIIARLAAEPRNLAIDDLDRLARLRGSGSRPSSAYRVWQIGRYVMPLTALVFLVFAAPVMQRTGRRETGTMAMVVGLGCGFVFLIVDGIAKTMSAAGAMSAWAAGVGPTLIFGLIGVYLWLRQETLATS